MSVSDSNTRTTITIPKDLKNKLEAMAKEQNRSLNNLIITVLMMYTRSSLDDSDRSVVMGFDYSDDPIIMEFDIAQDTD